MYTNWGHLTTIDLFTVYDAILAGGQRRLKLQWMYGILAHLEPLLTPLQRGGFPTFASALNSFIDITNKAIKGGTTFVNSNYKSSHVASIISWFMDNAD